MCPTDHDLHESSKQEYCEGVYELFWNKKKKNVHEQTINQVYLSINYQAINQTSVPSIIYVPCKVHKENIPIRPIVNSRSQEIEQY